jgi:hypothetical protein
MVSIVRGTIFFINRAHHLNDAYSNYLDIVLTATESSAGLMCACLPLTKPLVVRMTRWIQKWWGLDTGHQGWTTVSGSKQSKSLPGKGERGPRTITRVDEYEINLLARNTTGVMTEDGGFVTVEAQEGKLHCQKSWERLKQPWESLARQD